MKKANLSIPALDAEDREKRHEEAILLDGATIQIPAPHIDAAYFDRNENRWCLDYDHHHFLFVGEIWQEQKKVVSWQYPQQKSWQISYSNY